MGKKNKDLHYKNRSTRLADKTWERFKKKRKDSGKSWNIFVVETLDAMKKFEVQFRKEYLQERKQKGEKFPPEKSVLNGVSAPKLSSANGKLPPPLSDFSQNQVKEGGTTPQ